MTLKYMVNAKEMWNQLKEEVMAKESIIINNNPGSVIIYNSLKELQTLSFPLIVSVRHDYESDIVTTYRVLSESDVRRIRDDLHKVIDPYFDMLSKRAEE